MDSLESSKERSNDTAQHGPRSWFLPDMVPNHLFKGFIWVLCYHEMSQNSWWESWEFWSWAKIRFTMGGSWSIIEKKSGCFGCRHCFYNHSNVLVWHIIKYSFWTCLIISRERRFYFVMVCWLSFRKMHAF